MPYGKYVLFTALLLAFAAAAMATFVGETARISVEVRNSFGEDYRGFVSCHVERSDGTLAEPRSPCYLFREGETAVDVPLYLDAAGQWRIDKCTVHGELASSLPEERCSEAPEHSLKDIGISFTVTAPQSTIMQPQQGAVLAGTAAVESGIRGTFDYVSYSVSAGSQQCENAPLFEMSRQGAGTYAAAWDTSLFADREYWVCIIAEAAGTQMFLGSVRVSVNNYDFILQPVSEQLTTAVPVEHRINIINTGPVADSYDVSCSGSAPATLSVGGRAAECGSLPLSVEIIPGNAAPAILRLSPAPSQIVLAVANTQSEQKQSVVTVNSGENNSAPYLTGASASPQEVAQGGSVAFTAQLEDAENDAITEAKACFDQSCTEVICAFSAGFTCTAPVAKSAGTYTWYVYAKDEKGDYSATPVQEQLVVAAAPAGACAYSCLPSCADNADLCIRREAFSQQSCSSGMICCRETTMPACTPAGGCSIDIEKTQCTYDPVTQKYTATAQVAWSGGNHTIISIDGVQSPRLYEHSASHSVESAASTPKQLSASVYNSSRMEPLCSETGTIICGAPADISEPDGSTLLIAGADASSSTAGNGKNRAFDDNPATFWESESLPAWITVDLSQKMLVDGVGIYSLIDKPKDFTIEVSNDGSNWLSMSDVEGAHYESDWNVTRFGPAEARWVKITISRAERQDRNIVKINELRIYGTRPRELPPQDSEDDRSEPEAEFPWLLALAVIIIMAAAAIIVYKRERIKLWWEYMRS